MTTYEGIVAWPDLEPYSDVPMFNTKAVVQQTGVPAPTLRAWERRYVLLSPERANNAYRLYSERDIALIRWLKGRIDSGMAIRQAVALYRHLQEEYQRGLLSLQSQSRTADHEPFFQVATHPSLPEPPLHPFLPEQEQTPLPPDMPASAQVGQQMIEEAIQRGYRPVKLLVMLREQLIGAFRLFDDSEANTVIGMMLAVYSVEQVCTDLIMPVLWQIGQLWADGSISVAVEHFASNFFRALLTHLFHSAPIPHQGTLTIVCCAPGEPHELAALMLALFMRRRGVRVAYLGQAIETEGLIASIRQLRPALVCVSLTMSSYLPALIHLGRMVQRLPVQRPTFVFGGQVFAQFGGITSQIYGMYMDGDLKDVAEQLCNIVEQAGKDRDV
jgi:MerR family transcriptional regulator, light-induced transcriptional regulator